MDTGLVDACLPVSANSLGFSVTDFGDDPPPVGVSSRLLDKNPPAVSPETLERDYQALIKQDALVSVQMIGRDLAEVALDPATPVRQKLDINEQLIKLAGLDKKAADNNPNPGGGYQLVINFGNQPPETFSGVTIEQKPADTALPVSVENQ